MTLPEFRPMQKSDVVRIAELEKQCFRSPWSEDSLAGELKNRVAHYQVGEIDGVVMCYGGMWIMFGEAHITNVAVAPEYRRMGYGRVLMQRMIDTAVRFRATSMTLEVRVSNEAALGLYTSMGFEIAGRRKRYYSDTGEDGYIMWNKHIAQRAD